MAQLTLPPDPKIAARFWSKVDKNGPGSKPHLGPCWVWTRALQTAGYGNAWIDGTSRTAHKVAWVWANGPVPDGLQLDHLCENRTCCRPDHLEPVTSRENSHRTSLSVNSINAAKTHCSRGHELSGDNIYHYRGKRVCRACWRKDDAEPVVTAVATPTEPTPIVRVCSSGHTLRLLAGRYWCPPCAVRKAS